MNEGLCDEVPFKSPKSYKSSVRRGERRELALRGIDGRKVFESVLADVAA